ncbi:MAG: TonB-dependent receptor [Spongiibacteraceae bacterium]|jgi:iron complex outermembrane receptor protein|nr:TonB-dependent receptor [Spongiibacteraceae bacterium]
MGALLDVVDVEQIEVLRGPQGTLFGRNTSGGAIRYVTAKPEPEFGGKFIGAIGSYDRRDVTGIVNIPLTDELSSRFTVASKSRDGFIRRQIDGIKTGNSEITAARAQLRWQTDDWDVNLATDVLETKNDGVARVIPRRDPTHIYPNLLGDPTYSRAVTGDKYTVEGGDKPDYANVESFGITLTAEHNLNENWSIKSLTGFRDNESSAYQDWDLSTYNLYQTQQDTEFSNWSQEFQFNGSLFDGRLELVSGLFYMVEEAEFTNLRLNPGVPNGALVEFIDLETTSKAIYGQGTFKATDRLSFTLGLRWSEDEKDFYSAYGPLVGENNESWSSVTPRLGTEFQINDDVMVYLSAAKGFKSGGMNNRPQANIPNNGILPYDPEELWTYEAGFRSELADGRVRFNATYFHTKYEDIQTTAPRVVNGVPVQFTENAASATMEGIEFELTALLTDRLTLRAGGGWIDASYDDLGGATTLNKDTPFQRTPEYSYNIGFSYDQPLASGAQLSMNLDWGWKDKQFNNDSAVNGFYLPSYGLLNGRIAYEPASGKWELALVGTNLTDKYYKVTGFGGNPAETFFGFEQADIGRPREVGVELTVHF